MSVEKLTSLEQAAGLVRDGDTVAIQNMATQAAPMALVRELIRQGRRELGGWHLSGLVGRRRGHEPPRRCGGVHGAVRFVPALP